jgi:2-iminobutanoate/2-iminopropanoate deaminase
MANEAIFPDPLAKAVGPFSPAVRAGGFVYVSGQIGVDPASDGLVAGGVEAQTEQVIANLSVVLEAAGLGLKDVVRVGVYLDDMANYAAMNAVYARHFAEPFPARTAIGVAALPLGALVEMDLVARG